MPPFEALLPFLFGLLVLQLSPGPDMLLILDRGIAHGAKVAFSTIAGIVLVAGAVQIAMLVFGFGALIRSHPAFMPLLRSAGAAYLCYLGIRMLTTRLRAPDLVAVRPAGLGDALWEGAVSSLTNPKSFLFLFVVLPQFVDPRAGPVWLQMLVLGILHKLAGAVTLGSVALLAGRIGGWMRRWPRVLPIQRNLCGLVMIGLSAALATRIPYAP
ncbi:LysE family translocator [Aureimonas leprariae]|uniref:LysE family translocator n=1 Tax=Plantimonas leprariae TaxID=2615207 RepID=A0A7V7U1X9_9HYPH|nr:LysE family translocator [Aureimonas leprariae]KAB0682778.1 LysE family translocator [Aureimonas leprariae]